MKELKLSNGTTLDFAEESTIYNLVGVYDTYAEIDPIRAELTAENFDGATLNDEPVIDIVPMGISVNTDTMQGNIEVHFYTRKKTEYEIWQEEQDAAINMLLGL